MDTQLDKVSYVLGQQIGNDLRTQEIEVNSEVFLSSIKSALNGEDNKLSPEEMHNVMSTFQAEMQAKAIERANKVGIANQEEGLKFLEENKTKDGIITTDSGLQYKVLSSGEGNTPGLTSQVEVHYEGKLLNGEIFDSSYQRGQTTSFPVNGVIAGWTEALQLMKEGDVWEIFIPSALAYGSQGAGGKIGPNATLNFKVELVKVLS